MSDAIAASKTGALVRVLGPVRPDIDAVEVLEGGLTAPHAVVEALPAPPVCLAADEDGPAVKAPLDVAAQEVADLGEREGAVARLLERAERGEGAKEAVERLGLRAGRLGEIATRSRPVRE